MLIDLFILGFLSTELGYGLTTVKGWFFFTQLSRMIGWELTREMGCKTCVSEEGNATKLGSSKQKQNSNRKVNQVSAHEIREQSALLGNGVTKWVCFWHFLSGAPGLSSHHPSSDTADV